MSEQPISGIVLGLGAYRETARLCAMRAEQMTDVSFQVVDKPLPGFPAGAFPGYLKLYIFELAHSETVLYLDADAVVVKPWSLNGMLNCREFIAVRDQYIDLDPHSHPEIPRSTYFNSGMFIANRTHHTDMFEAASRLWERGTTFPSPLHDQPFLNYALNSVEAPLRLLDSRYNCLRYHLRDDVSEAVVAHYTPHGRQSAHDHLTRLLTSPIEQKAHNFQVGA